MSGTIDVLARLTDPDWQHAAARERIVGPWAELGMDIPAVDELLRALVATLGSRPEINVEHAEFRHYGSGFASYVDVLITHRDGSLRTAGVGGNVQVRGITLLLCRLAPIAALLRDGERSTGPGGRGGYSLPERDRLADNQIDGWQDECQAVTAVLDRFGIAVPKPYILHAPALDGLKIDTNLATRGGGYALFDVWFHWED